MTDNKEREAFGDWLRRHPNTSEITDIEAKYMEEAWQARAALAASQDKAEPVAYAVTSISEAWTDFYTASEKDAIPESFDDGTHPVVTALYAAPVAAQASEPAGRDWRVALVVSSSDPSKHVRWLADGAAEIARVEQHRSFIRWLDTPQPSAEVVRDAAYEAAARLIETTNETTTVENGGETLRHLTERKGSGNLTGMAWAAGIRALKSAPPQPAEQPDDEIDDLFDRSGWVPAEQPSASPTTLDAACEIAALRWAVSEAEMQKLAAIAGPLSRILARTQGEQAAPGAQEGA